MEINYESGSSTRGRISCLENVDSHTFVEFYPSFPLFGSNKKSWVNHRGERRESMEYTRKNGEYFFSVVFNGGLRGSQRDCIKIIIIASSEFLTFVYFNRN